MISAVNFFWKISIALSLMNPRIAWLVRTVEWHPVSCKVLLHSVTRSYIED